jgi:diguanylate cyclase (GGDEF)-like protein
VKLHRAETAFFIFMVQLLVAAAMLAAAYWRLSNGGSGPGLPGAAVPSARSAIVLSGVLVAAAIVFGIFFILPLIRTQVREEVKLRAMTETLSARSVTLENAALTDALTGTQNRRYFDDALREYLAEFGRIGKPVGLMILDLDHFKAVNDTHGHDVGDEVLRSVADCLQNFTRYHDVVARLGGEEFAIVVPNMDEFQLQKFAERIRQAIAALVIRAGSATMRVTTSVGLAVWDGREDPDAFYRRADRMLYQAKKQGRNRVCA